MGFCSRDRFVRVARQRGGRDRNSISRKHARQLDRIEPGALFAQHAIDDRTHRGDIGREILRQIWRRRHQELAGFLVTHEMHEAVDRRGFGRVIRNAGRLERFRRRTVFAHPHGEHRLRRCVLLALSLGHGDDGFRRIGSRRERRRHVHDQNGIIGVIVEQILKRDGISFGVGITGDVGRIGVRPDRRQSRIKLPHGVGRNAASSPPRSTSRSTARTPTPPPLVKMARRLPDNVDKRASVSAAANSSSRSMTRTKPARRNAAS